MTIYEMQCERDGELFLADGPDNFEHEAREDGTECGADGRILREITESSAADKAVLDRLEQAVDYTPAKHQPTHLEPPLQAGDRVVRTDVTGADALYVWEITGVWWFDTVVSREPFTMRHGWAVSARRVDGTGISGTVTEMTTAVPAGVFRKLPAMPAEHRVFTFGSAHTHPDTDESLNNCAVRIPGGFDVARARMMVLFGDRWAFDYSPESFEQTQSRYGVREVVAPSNPKRFSTLRRDQAQWVYEVLGDHAASLLPDELRGGR